MSLISGLGTTPVDKGFSAGKKVADMYRQKDYQSIMNSDIQYEYIDPSTGKYSIDSGLAYSRESLKALDADTNGIVGTNEAGQYGSLLDLNNDGQVGTAENLAWTILQDFSGNFDGIVTPKDIENVSGFADARPAETRNYLQQIFAALNLGKRESDFNAQYPDQSIAQASAGSNLSLGQLIA